MKAKFYLLSILMLVAGLFITKARADFVVKGEGWKATFTDKMCPAPILTLAEAEGADEEMLRQFRYGVTALDGKTKFVKFCYIDDGRSNLTIITEYGAVFQLKKPEAQ